MAEDSVGKISLDLQIMSDLNGQIKSVAQSIGAGVKNSVNQSFKGAFDGMKKNAVGSMDGIGKNIKSVLSRAAQSVKGQMQDITKGVAEAFNVKPKTDASGQAFGKQADAIRKQQILVDELRFKYEQMLSGNIKPTALKNAEAELKRQQKEIQQTDKAWEAADQRMKNLQQQATFDKAAHGVVSPGTNTQIKQLEKELDALGIKLNESDEKAKTLQKTISEIRMNPGASDELDIMQSKLDAATMKLDGMQMGTEGAGSSFNGVSAAAGGFSSTLSALGVALDIVVVGMKKAAEFGATVGRGFRSLVDQTIRAMTTFNVLGKSADNFGQSIFRLGNMLKMMVTRRALNGILSGAKEGFQNLAQYSNSTNAAISSLMSAMSRLKNSFAAAFAPILDVVAPILTTLINMLATAISYVGAFFAALSGKSSYTRAVGVTQDYAAALSGAAGAANDANEAAKEYQGTIAGFDELNNLNKEDSSGSGGGGSGGGGGGGGGGDMFETVPIDSWISDFANNIKDLINAQDWAGIGKLLGEKLNSVVDMIPWAEWGTKLGKGIDAAFKILYSLLDTFDFVKLGQGIATLFNNAIAQIDFGNVGATFAKAWNSFFDLVYGIITTTNWKQVGLKIADYVNGWFGEIKWVDIANTIGLGIRGVVDMMVTALTNINWKKMAFDLASGINTLVASLLKTIRETDWNKVAREFVAGLNVFINEVNWYDLGELIYEGAMAALDFLSTVAEEFDWAGFGRSISEFLEGLKWAEIFEAISNVGDQFADGVWTAVKGFFESGWERFKDYFRENIEAVGGNGGAGLIKGMSEALNGMVRKIFQPLIDGIKDFFGIHSPSTVFAEFGANMIQGLINGIKSLIDTVVRTFTGIWENIKNVFAGVADFFSTIFTNAWNGIQNAFSSIGTFFSGIWENITQIFSNTGSWFSEKFSSAWNGIKTAFSTVGDFFSGVWNNITGVFSNVSGWFQEKFSAAWEAVKNVFSTGGKIFDGIKDGILNGLKTVINAIIGGINKVISVPFNGLNSALSGLRGVSIAGLKPFSWLPSIGVPQIPMLAKGGIIETPTLAMVGEAGKEAVVPLENNTGWMVSLANIVAEAIVGKLAMMQNTQSSEEGQSQDIKLTLDGRTLGELAMPYILDAARRRGTPISLSTGGM